jgi:two-component system OmpR family sensor kinase
LPIDRTFHGDALILTVGLADGPVQSTLSQLALAMGVVSVGIWMTAAIWGRWLCRRGLHPIIRMAASARAIRRAAKPEQFLDVAATGDELEELGREFNELLTSLRESLDRQQRFTGDASHQLRTPLTAMLASVEVAMTRERRPDEYRRVLEVVSRRGKQIRQIIESLLFIARAESGSPLPEPDAIELGEWCRGRLEGWSEHTRSADLSIQASVPVFVFTQQALLGQALDNLLDNACKYSRAGTPIVIGVSQNDLGAVVNVSDEGCGIAAEECQRVFEPFYRSSHARWEGALGVGLGLTVALRLVALIGGTIEVRSEPGKGSTFEIALPPGKTDSESRQVGQQTEIASRPGTEACTMEAAT